MIHNILQEINLENGSNHKKKVLEQNKDNELLKRVLRMAMDKVTYTYGITMKNIEYKPSDTAAITLEEALDELEQKFCTGEYTGNNAISKLQELLESLKSEDALLVEKIIGRDLKLGVNAVTINKVINNLISKPVYTRCNIYGPKTAKDITFPAILQIKADGMAMFVNISEDVVECYTRSGETFILDSLQYLKDNPNLINNTIQGEFLINGEQKRSNSNGLINSLIKYKQGSNKTLSEENAKEIEDKIIFQVWDLISKEDMIKAKNKDETSAPYKERWYKLQSII